MPPVIYKDHRGNGLPSVTTIIGRFKESGGLLYWPISKGVGRFLPPLFPITRRRGRNLPADARFVRSRQEGRAALALPASFSSPFGTLRRSLVWSQHASFSRNHADNRLSPWLHLHPLNANNLGHAALHPVIGFDRTVQRVFKFCASGRHRDHVAFADAGVRLSTLSEAVCRQAT